MLRQTFLHIPGVGATAERALWLQGCLSWEQLLAGMDEFSIGTASRATAQGVLRESIRALDVGTHQYFAQKLGLGEAWRAFPEFRDSCVYLDIETDGGQDGESVTMVGLYDGLEYRALIRDEDLGELPDVISKYGMIVTFFGSGFDLPMLQRKFWGIRFDQIHLDLCPTLRRVGYRGGLKKIERELGISRSDDTDGLTGWDAVKLWREWENGSPEALATLVAYNREDVVHLEQLAEIAYAKLRNATLPSSLASHAPDGSSASSAS